MNRERRSPPPLRAFAVQEEDEGTGGIVFARHAVTARREGAAEYNGGDFSGLSCRRAAWADEYAPGPVPATIMVQHGWWMHCHGCDRKVGEGFENEARSRFDPVMEGDDFYCTPTCAAIGRLGIDVPREFRLERLRQVEVEGYTPEHDVQISDGNLLRAAVVYFQHATRTVDLPTKIVSDAGVPVKVPVGWPWDPQWWKPKTPRRDLERAGALCLAEIDRSRRTLSPFGPALDRLCLAIAAYKALPA